MVRMTVGTYQDHGSRQASASFLQEKRVPPDGFLTSGSHTIVNIVNKQDNCTRSGKHPGPSSACSIFFGTDKGINWVVREQWPI